MKSKFQFKEISYAFEVLSDENKKRVYDQGGIEALKEGYYRFDHRLMLKLFHF